MNRSSLRCQVARWMPASLLLALAAGSASAMPAVMDRVPTTAIATVAVPNFGAFRKDLENLGTLMQLPVQQGIDQMGLLKADAKGVRQDGAVAVVIFAPEKAGGAEAKDLGGEGHEGGEPALVVLVPVTGYADFLGNFAAKPGGGVDAIQIEGEPVFAKDLGDGYAALAKTAEHLGKVDGKKGHLAEHTQAAGKAGNALADRSDLFVAVNMSVARPLLKDGLKQAFAQVESMPAVPNAGDPAKVAEIASKFAGEAVDQTQAIIAGLNIDNLGVALDSVTTFAPGSRYATLASGGGKAGSLLAKLPAMPYLVAGGLDLSNKAVREWMIELSQLSAAAAPPGQRAINEAQAAALQHIDGAAGIIGVSPAGLMGGVLSNTVSFVSTAKPDEVIKSGQDAYKGLVDAKLATGKYEPGKKDIDGLKVDSYEYRFLSDPSNPGMAMGAGMIFGPTGGPAGYIGKVDGGLIQTLGKSDALIASTLKSIKGENSLAGDKTLAQIGDKLPANRTAEAYVSVKDLLNQLLPMAAMFGAPVAVDVPQNLPPIGAAIAPSEGSVTASVYLPAPVLKTVAEVVRQVQAAIPAGGQAEDNQGGGQPAF